MQNLDKPNILMIQADQLSALALSCYGHPAAKTPNIDKLAAKGVLFTNAYCNSPLCGPSRNSMMSGRIPHRIDAYDNASELPASVPTFTHVLTNNDYECVLSGKMHFVGPDQLHGFKRRMNTDIYPSDFEWTPDWTRGAYGNQGTSVHYLHQSGPCSWSLQLDYDEETSALGLRALRDLTRERNSRNEPFFLCVSFTQPHDPFTPQKKYWDMYSDVDIPAPGSPAKPLEEMHPYDQWIQIHHEIDKYPPSMETVMKARRSYIGMVTYIDELTGKLIDELDNLGIAEDTVVCFSSDHGDMQGEHGMWYKRTYREWATRVPMIFHVPGTPEGLTVDSPVSLLDLFPTITDIAQCGTSWPGAECLEGDSLLPLIRGEKETNFSERPVFIEYCGEGTTEPMAAVRRGKWKFVGVNKYEPMLFDLKSDRLENTNLIYDKNGESKEAADSLSHLVDDYWDFEKQKAEVIQDQEKRQYLYRSLNRNNDIWDYEPEYRAAEKWVRRGRSTQSEKSKHRWPYVPRE